MEAAGGLYFCNLVHSTPSFLPNTWRSSGMVRYSAASNSCDMVDVAQEVWLGDVMQKITTSRSMILKSHLIPQPNISKIN